MIRQATKEDIHIVVEMTKSMREDLGMDYEDAYVVNLVVKALKLAPCFLLLKDDRIIGMAGLSVSFCAFSNQATLTDYGFYIQPRHRSYGLFCGLINKVKDYSKEVGLPLRLNLQANISNKVREKLFKRHGFKVISMIGEYNE